MWADMCTLVNVFQFTPLREGRLFGVLAILGVVNISIHAPT